MNEPLNKQTEKDPQIVIVGPEGMAVGGGDEERQIIDMVEQPSKVMRIGSMIRQLLDEVLAPELVSELERLSLPFAEEAVPSEAELRIAQAQLVGWLEGLFHGIQTTLFAQQMAARAQLEQMRRALPGGTPPAKPAAEPEQPRTGPYL
jgi:hypothetical protein